MKKSIFTVVTLMFSLISMANHRKEVSKVAEYERANLICIAQVVRVESDFFSFRIIENLKGEVSEVIKVSRGEESINAEFGEQWLLYAMGDGKNNIFSVYRNGWSRQLEFPNHNKTSMPLPPPCLECPSITLEELLIRLEKLTYRSAKVTELNTDIGDYRLEKQNNILLKHIKQLEQEHLQLSYKLNVIIAFLLLFIVIFIFYGRKRS